MPEHAQPLDTWAIVEVMGHKQFAGYVTEQVIGSMALVRVDVPETDQPNSVRAGAYTKLIGVGSIYCITPCTEPVARAVARRLGQWNNPIPVDLPAVPQLPAGAAVDDAEIADDDEDDEDDEESIW